MLIEERFEVDQPVERVWELFQDIPQVAACLPGTELTDRLDDDTYAGTVAIRMGPVRLEFEGKAVIQERDEAARRIVVDAAGADTRGRGQAAMLVTAGLAPTARGTRVDVGMDLQLSGAAAQYGRGMVSDVTAVLIKDFAANARVRVDALARGLSPDQIESARPASGLAVGLSALRLALARVFARFFLPYRPTPS